MIKMKGRSKHFMLLAKSMDHFFVLATVRRAVVRIGGSVDTLQDIVERRVELFQVEKERQMVMRGMGPTEIVQPQSLLNL